MTMKRTRMVCCFTSILDYANMFKRRITTLLITLMRKLILMMSMIEIRTTIETMAQIKRSLMRMMLLSAMMRAIR